MTDERRMGNSVEHGRFDNGIMNHILKNDLISNIERFFKAPVTHKITCQTTIPSHSVGRFSEYGICGTNYSRLIGHLKAIWHMASERYIEHCCLYPFVFDDINHCGNHPASFPSKSTAGFQDKLNMRKFSLECFQHLDKVIGVVSFSGHQMPPSHV